MKIIALSISLFALTPLAHGKISEALVLKMKKTVVNVEKSVSQGLNVEGVGRSFGTGFIVDAERGIVATNRHVSGTSPTQVKITFENGESTEAHILYYDIYHDFAFYQLDMSSVNFPIHEVSFSGAKELQEQDEVFMIGNNDVEEYSVKFGRITNLVVDKGDRHSATFQTSFDRAGGSSGSPVMNSKGIVIGIHYKGTSTTSFEMHIAYLRDALKQIRKGKRVNRGETGIELDLMHISDARKHFHLPEKVAGKIKSLRKDIKRMIFVDRIIPMGPAEGILQPGDLVVRLEDEYVSDNVYLFDKIADGRVGKAITLEIYRNGKRLSLKVDVLDAEKTKVRKYVSFAGGLFHDITLELRRRYEIETPGVFLSHADRGTSMSKLGFGVSGQPTAYVVMVEEINGIPTPDLSAFIEAVKPLENKERIYMLVRNLRSYRNSTNAHRITLELQFQPLKVFEFNSETLDWVENKS